MRHVIFMPLLALSTTDTTVEAEALKAKNLQIATERGKPIGIVCNPEEKEQVARIYEETLRELYLTT